MIETTYIAFLRGINVSGHKIIKMADLRALLETTSLKNISTYIQSGNIVFTSEQSALESEQIIRSALFDRYGWEIPVLVKTSEELEEIIANCPFETEKQLASYYTLLSKVPDSENVDALRSIDFGDEEVIIIGNCVYYFCSKGYARAKMSNKLLENKLKVAATTRNHRTLTKMIGLAKGELSV